MRTYKEADEDGVGDDDGDGGDGNCEQVIWETADLPVNLCLPPPNHPTSEDTKYIILMEIHIQNTGTNTNTNTKYM